MFVVVVVIIVIVYLEREETVKSDIFQAYRMLLNVTKSSIRVTDVDQDHMETSERYNHIYILVTMVTLTTPL